MSSGEIAILVLQGCSMIVGAIAFIKRDSFKSNCCRGCFTLENDFFSHTPDSSISATPPPQATVPDADRARRHTLEERPNIRPLEVITHSDPTDTKPSSLPG